MFRRAASFLLLCCISLGGGHWNVVAEMTLRVLVLENAAPMSFRDQYGQFTGFSVEIARAVCAEMRVNCVLEVSAQTELIERLMQGKADFAATGMLQTPDRRGKLLFAKPYFRSFTLWLAPAGIEPGRAGVTVAAIQGSAQADYGLAKGWKMHLVTSNDDLAAAVLSGTAQATLVAMARAISLQGNEAFRRLDLARSILHAPELEGDVAFGVSPLHPELLGEINAALVRIKRNGTYDRINSRYLPFRVS